MSTQAEALRSNFKQLDGIQTLGSLLLNLCSFDADDLGFLGPIASVESSVNGMYSRLIKDLTTAPLDFVKLPSVRILNISQHPPIRLGHKLLDFLRLIYTKSQRGSLTRSISEHSDASSSNGVDEFVGLEPRERYSNLEVKDLSCID